MQRIGGGRVLAMGERVKMGARAGNGAGEQILANEKGLDFTSNPLFSCGAPGRTRTPDRLLRRQLLYPPELLARKMEAFPIFSRHESQVAS